MVYCLQNLDILVALTKEIDIDDEEVVQCMIGMFPDSEHTWDIYTTNLFKKLVDLGGKLALDGIMCLPRDSYVYYTETNDFAISTIVIQFVINSCCYPEINDLLCQKIEFEIMSLEQSSLLLYIVALIREGRCTDIALQEIYNRQLIDTLFV